ncbi:MAG: DUF305 domain-containing protein [Actinomadura sp.]
MFAILAVAGCTGGGTAAPTATPGVVGSGAPVIVPGRPGEPARTAAPGEKVNTGVAAANAADIRFVQMMIPHHQQALEMTALVKDRTTNKALRGLAERISAAQTGEIAFMRTWLRTRSLPVDRGHTGHGAAQMPGMATDGQLEKLRDADGAAFDRQFLQLMIVHHQGALTMAAEVLKSGAEATAYRMALDVNASQGVEIRRMQGML